MFRLRPQVTGFRSVIQVDVHNWPVAHIAARWTMLNHELFFNMHLLVDGLCHVGDSCVRHIIDMLDICQRLAVGGYWVHIGWTKYGSLNLTNLKVLSHLFVMKHLHILSGDLSLEVHLLIIAVSQSICMHSEVLNSRYRHRHTPSETLYHSSVM